LNWAISDQPSSDPRSRGTVPRLLIAAGVVLIVAGLLLKAGLPLGRLPGDVIIRRGDATFYFPIVTCIVVSVVLSLLMAVLRR
jgi:hypothetical protein